MLMPVSRNSVLLPHLRAWRVKALMTQAQLAKAAGVDTWTVGRAEAGKSVAPLTVERLARALGISSKDLIAKEPE